MDIFSRKIPYDVQERVENTYGDLLYCWKAEDRSEAAYFCLGVVLANSMESEFFEEYVFETLHEAEKEATRLNAEIGLWVLPRFRGRVGNV